MSSVKDPKSKNVIPDRQAERQEAALRLGDDVLNYARQYARERPDVVALWCLGVGFILGWKLKPW
jgi:hypothetical protein